MPVDPVALIAGFRSLRAVVVGDVMLDRYSAGSSKRLCQEAPVPVVDVRATKSLAGAAANSAANLRALGSRVTLISVTGADTDGRILKRILEEQQVGLTHLEA